MGLSSRGASNLVVIGHKDDDGQQKQLLMVAGKCILTCQKRVHNNEAENHRENTFQQQQKNQQWIPGPSALSIQELGLSLIKTLDTMLRQ